MRSRRSLGDAAVASLGGLGLGMLVLATPLDARADGELAKTPAVAAREVISPELMVGLAQHAARFEEMKRRGAFTMTGRIEEVDGDGRASDTKEITLRSTPTAAPMDRITKVFQYTENGEDKTVDAQKRATERRAKRLKDPEKQADERKRDLKLPFLASEQARYVFSVVERDVAQPSRVRVAFTPHTPAENAIRGSAWVDEKEREVLSVGFSLSKNPTFVDHVDITIVFGLPTELGRAPSKLSFDGRGGFLFIRKHYRGTATLSQPALAF
jgi:hypothetical protein